MPRSLAFAALAFLSGSSQAQVARENMAVPNNGPTTLALGSILFDAQALLREAEWYIEQEKARVKGKAAMDSER